MLNPSQRAINLLVCCLYFLDQQTKGKIMAYMCGNKLDTALYRMIKEKLFPDWFGKEFSDFDPLYARLCGLRYALTHAIAKDKTLELVVSGGVARYRFPMSKEECAGRLAELGIASEQARQLAQTLQQYLSESEKK